MRYISEVKIPRFVFIVAVVAGLLLGVALLPVEQLLFGLQEWVQTHQKYAFAVVTAFITIGFVLCLPSSVLTMTAGFLFGMGWGYASVWFATLVASSLAFWIARSAARKWFERKIRRNPLFMAIDRAIQRKGILIVMLARIVMVLPYPGFNYMLGLTSVRYRDFLIGTMVGMSPIIFLFVFLGKTAGSIAAIMHGEIALEEQQVTLVALGAIVLLVAIGVIVRLAGRVLREELKSG